MEKVSSAKSTRSTNVCKKSIEVVGIQLTGLPAHFHEHKIYAAGVDGGFYFTQGFELLFQSGLLFSRLVRRAAATLEKAPSSIAARILLIAYLHAVLVQLVLIIQGVPAAAGYAIILPGDEDVKDAVTNDPCHVAVEIFCICMGTNLDFTDSYLII